MDQTLSSDEPSYSGSPGEEDAPQAASGAVIDDPRAHGAAMNAITADPRAQGPAMKVASNPRVQGAAMNAIVADPRAQGAAMNAGSAVAPGAVPRGFAAAPATSVPGRRSASGEAGGAAESHGSLEDFFPKPPPVSAFPGGLPSRGVSERPRASPRTSAERLAASSAGLTGRPAASAPAPKKLLPLAPPRGSPAAALTTATADDVDRGASFTSASSFSGSESDSDSVYEGDAADAADAADTAVAAGDAAAQDAAATKLQGLARVRAAKAEVGQKRDARAAANKAEATAAEKAAKDAAKKKKAEAAKAAHEAKQRQQEEARAKKLEDAKRAKEARNKPALPPSAKDKAKDKANDKEKKAKKPPAKVASPKAAAQEQAPEKPPPLAPPSGASVFAPPPPPPLDASSGATAASSGGGAGAAGAGAGASADPGALFDSPRGRRYSRQLVEELEGIAAFDTERLQQPQSPLAPPALERSLSKRFPATAAAAAHMDAGGGGGGSFVTAATSSRPPVTTSGLGSRPPPRAGVGGLGAIDERGGFTNGPSGGGLSVETAFAAGQVDRPWERPFDDDNCGCDFAAYDARQAALGEGGDRGDGGGAGFDDDGGLGGEGNGPDAHGVWCRSHVRELRSQVNFRRNMYKLAKEWCYWQDKLMAAPITLLLLAAAVLNVLAALGYFPNPKYTILCVSSAACTAAAGLITAFRMHEKFDAKAEAYRDAEGKYRDLGQRLAAEWELSGNGRRYGRMSERERCAFALRFEDVYAEVRAIQQAERWQVPSALLRYWQEQRKLTDEDELALDADLVSRMSRDLAVEVRASQADRLKKSDEAKAKGLKAWFVNAGKVMEARKAKFEK